MFTNKRKNTSSVTKTIFGLRRNVIHNGSLSQFTLIRHYHLALFKATLNALGCETEEIVPDEKSNDTGLEVPDYIYVRDPVLILHDKKLILSTKGNEYYCSKDLIAKIENLTDYKSMVIPKAYFEGGNLFYLPFKKVVLHGLDPAGYYELSGISAFKTTEILKETLSSYDIQVLGLNLKPELIRENTDVYCDYYYHLDCFMQILPTGQLLILNRHILTLQSQWNLYELLGENFIDLAYPDYLTNPCLFNFVSFTKQDKIYLISDILPEFVLSALETLNLTVITPAMLNASHPSFDRSLAELVIVELKSQGYDTMTPENLSTHVAFLPKGYLLDNGTKHLLNPKDKLLASIDLVYQKEAIKFTYGGGGPHCLTIEISPSIGFFNKKIKKNPELTTKQSLSATGHLQFLSSFNSL